MSRKNPRSATQGQIAALRAAGVQYSYYCAACLILLPMLLGFQFKGDAFSHPWLSAAMIALVSWLMVSRVPTLSLKRLRVPPRLKAPVIVVAILLLGSALLWPWVTLTIGLLFYLASIPFGIAAAAETHRHRDSS